MFSFHERMKKKHVTIRVYKHERILVFLFVLFISTTDFSTEIIMIQTMNWIVWKLFIIYISLDLFSLKLVNSEENSNSIITDEDYDHYNSSLDSSNNVKHSQEAFHRNSDPDGFPEYEFLNETSIEIKEELGQELHQLQLILDELSRRIRATPNSANKYMKNEFLMSSCIVITLNLFIFMYKS
ncbi:surface membrane antigen [Schistosoma mansoni]|uniref:Gp18-22 Sm n=4 Tax=Schistosoma mansoni TaxID=6183 RepID=Q04171_SCHMA|nr:surface membrane antigen [Schistosoma mansoni]AAA29943.1 gp18-22 Sm [Schistosoma mansoni]AAC98907.1 surface membrane antigen [Schistosoma mansoni]|eukprot:XP_018652921.1 surface membrane antigen [Schistosoma mansoni]